MGIVLLLINYSIGRRDEDKRFVCLVDSKTPCLKSFKFHSAFKPLID
jgi:hypothetical protein